jgi:hypothetical protein
LKPGPVTQTTKRSCDDGCHHTTGSLLFLGLPPPVQSGEEGLGGGSRKAFDLVHQRCAALDRTAAFAVRSQTS